MSHCCDAAGDRKTPTWVQSVRENLAWVVPSAILVLVPKCPACLAAHVTLWTGLGHVAFHGNLRALGCCCFFASPQCSI